MDPTVTAALVAGAVSALGIIVQLYIARRTRQDTSDALKQQTRTTATLQVSNEIRALQAHAEKVRILGWAIHVKLDNLIRYPQHSRRPTTDELNRDFEAFRIQADEFTKAWADVKSDIPPNIIDYARTKRHDCRNKLASLSGHWKLFIQSSNETSEFDSHLKIVTSEVLIVLTEIDTFDHVMRYARQGLIDSVTI